MDAIENLTPTKLSRAAGISVPYASQLLRKIDPRTPSFAMAIRIYRETGHKLGPIAGASHGEIETLEQFHGRAA